jgi:hypothetical protein
MRHATCDMRHARERGCQNVNIPACKPQELFNIFSL